MTTYTHKIITPKILGLKNITDLDFTEVETILILKDEIFSLKGEDGIFPSQGKIGNVGFC